MKRFFPRKRLFLTITGMGLILTFLLMLGVYFPALGIAKTGKMCIFDRFNKTYQDLTAEIGSVQQGPLMIQFKSPRQLMTLKKHSLFLQPNQDETHQANLQLEFQGSGNLVAEVGLAGLNSQLEDQVLVPLQKKVLNARVRLVRTEGGYRLTTISLPKQLDLEIRSNLASRLVGWCFQVSLVPLSVLDCNQLDRKLSKVVFPLTPNQSYFISNQDLTTEERQEIDAYLGVSKNDTG
jgi:hypothetical protein